MITNTSELIDPVALDKNKPIIKVVAVKVVDKPIVKSTFTEPLTLNGVDYNNIHDASKALDKTVIEVWKAVRQEQKTEDKE